MLFINLEEYNVSFHIYGEKTTFDDKFRSSGTLCVDYLVNYEAFSKLVGPRTKAFDYAELLGFKIRGYVSVAQGVLTDRTRLGDQNIAGLLMFHKNLKTELSFTDWLKLVPGIGDSRSSNRTNLSVLFTEEGQWLLVFLKDGRVGHELINERCFIKGGEIVTLAQVIQNRRNQIAEQERRLEQQVARFDTHSFQISEELHRSDLLNNSVFNPSRS